MDSQQKPLPNEFFQQAPKARVAKAKQFRLQKNRWTQRIQPKFQRYEMQPREYVNDQAPYLIEGNTADTIFTVNPEKEGITDPEYIKKAIEYFREATLEQKIENALNRRKEFKASNTQVARANATQLGQAIIDDQAKQNYADKKPETKAILDAIGDISRLLNPLKDISMPSLKAVDPTIKFADKEASNKSELSAIKQILASKFNTTPEQFSKPGDKQGFLDLQDQLADMDDLTLRKLQYLLLLNSWYEPLTNIIRKSRNLGRQFIHPIISETYDNYSNKLDNQNSSQSQNRKNQQQPIGNDEGIRMEDYTRLPLNNQQIAIQPVIKAKVPGVNEFNETFVQNPWAALSYDRVNIKAIQTILYPEVYSYRYPLPNPTKTAIGKNQITLTLATNLNGTAGMYIYPYHSYNASVSPFPFASVFNAAAFDPLTGTGGVSTAFDGPFFPNQASMRQYYLISTSIQLDPLANQNVNGRVQICYCQSSQPVSQQAIANQGQYVSGNAYASYRMILPRTQLSSSLLNRNTDYLSQLFYILLTGFPSGAPINAITVTITQTCEFIPEVGFAGICPVEYADSGCATEECTNDVLAKHEILQIATLPTIQAVTNALADSRPSYPSVIETISQTLKGVSKPLNMVIPASLPMQVMDID